MLPSNRHNRFKADSLKQHTKEQRFNQSGYVRKWHKTYTSEPKKSHPNNILRINILDSYYQITTDILYYLFCQYGNVQRIVIFVTNGAMIEFDSIEGASLAKKYLNGFCLFSGCNKMQIEFAWTSKLFVKHNDVQKSWDYSKTPYNPNSSYQTQRNYQEQDMNQITYGASFQNYQSSQSYFNTRNINGDYSISHFNQNLTSFAKTPLQQPSIVLVSGLPEDVTNPDMLFNLLSLYGNISRIQFLFNLQGSAIVQMFDAVSADNCIKFLNHINIGMNGVLQVFWSDQHVFPSNKNAFMLRDGVWSFKDFADSKNQRFLIPRPSYWIQPPSKIIRFYNLPPNSSETDILAIFAMQNVPAIKGRSTLHMACSNSKPEIVEFLVRSGANVVQKDLETSWTPLHRAVQYISFDSAVILKRYGASFDSFDLDFTTPLQLLPSIPAKAVEKAVYVWGRNKNYNLGFGNASSRTHPDTLKGLPPIEKASVNRFHSLFLTSSRKLFGCGYGKEGRLGTGSESILTDPQEINVKFNHKNEKIENVYAGLTHSFIVTMKSVYGTGSNKYFQLGLKNVESTLSFMEIHIEKAHNDLKCLKCIIANDYHTVFVSHSAVFVCGLNVGQFGGIQESVPVPRVLSHPAMSKSHVEWVASNNASIFIYTHGDARSVNSGFNLCIFYNRKVKIYRNPLNEYLVQCCVSGGEMMYNSDEIVANSSQKPLTAIVMTEYKNLYIWYEDVMKFVRIHISSMFERQITSISTCGDDFLIIAKKHLFQATLQHKMSKNYQIESKDVEFTPRRDVEYSLSSKMSVKRIQYLSNVLKTYCDVDGESFMAILENGKVEVKDRPKEKYDFTSLLDSDHYIYSGIMDVMFNVQQESFYANRFVVSSQCVHLKNLIDREIVNKVCTIKDERLTPAMFRCILLWIYKADLNEQDLTDVFINQKDSKRFEIAVNNFYDIAVEWNLKSVVASLIKFKTFNKILKQPESVNNVTTFKWFSMENLPELYDVTILLNDNQIIKAHKVVLMMRIEYFKMMFAHSWSEGSSIDLRHISINFMKPIIQFAYDNNVDMIMKANFTDNFMFNMCTILDQYLIENVKNIFETMLMKKVNLRNCVENLEFSYTFNCLLLREHCHEFICLNLSRLLESNIFDNIDLNIMKELNLYYRKYFKLETESCHIITPAFDAPSEEEIDKVVGDFDLSSYCDAMEQTLNKPQKTRKKMTKSEILKRNYEKEGMKNMRDEEVFEIASPTSPELNNSFNNDKTNEHDDDCSNNWQKKKKERKNSGKSRVLTAAKVNEILKNDEVVQDDNMMVELKSFRKSLSEEPSEPLRNSITLADFGIKTKKKVVEVSPKVETTSIEVEKAKSAWNMDNVDLHPINIQNPSDPFNLSSTKKGSSSKKSPKVVNKPLIERNFTSIIRDEYKDKSNYEKIKSKSLILTQIEEQAIMELSEFYNIENIFDENITIRRKVQSSARNLSQWQH
ncbi:CLUMA_CG004840, isoform A [Clunio marinus]|uniref:CLUMA_CG004840, isoform A n=1 Tax=Clunio marinus TaxID=568069 RepID=A0A1J1HT33_9DIPT|nr:CLUMA_CG004840, isoform A [Clunio marinus]